ncbi:MAG TPA: MerR family transcriptional regulator [Candidatus Limnocylindria bacterium]|nr:MerR family transcriptional regulator [Candidatus Limnocylindria bacterium]
MQIGQLARDLGVSADTLRFYERSGVLPRPERRENGYRDYGPPDVERLRLLIELRRLDIPIPDAARIAGWCQSGHCVQTTAELPRLLAERRSVIRGRIASLQRLDQRLERLERHVSLAELPLVGQSAPCCAAAAMLDAH